MIKILRHSVSISRPELIISTTIRAGDYKAYMLVLTFLDLVSIPGNVRLRFLRSDGQQIVTEPVTIDENRIEYELPTSVIEKVSPLTCWVQFSNENLYTPLKITFTGIEEMPTDEGLPQTDEYPELLRIIEEGTAVITEAKDAIAAVNAAIPVKGVDYFDGEQGTPGEPGYTPIKGLDYFDGEPGAPGTNGTTPVKGVDYFDGTPGAPGYTPVKGIDYFDGQDGAPGLSAYASAVLGGYTDTEENFYAQLSDISLIGDIDTALSAIVEGLV